MLLAPRWTLAGMGGAGADPSPHRSSSERCSGPTSGQGMRPFCCRQKMSEFGAFGVSKLGSEGCGLYIVIIRTWGTGCAGGGGVWGTCAELPTRAVTFSK